MANILVVGPHPDDQELGMGGTIALLASQGHDVLLLDMTNGEPTPLGSPETRAKEAARAAEILGAHSGSATLSGGGGGNRGRVRRVCLNLPNREVVHSVAARHGVARVIREHQASVIFTPHFEDAHPDHLATTRIVEDARFDAKLTRMSEPGRWKGGGDPPEDAAHPPLYPKWLFYYYCTHLRHTPAPSFCVDISAHLKAKMDSIRAYESQFVRANAHVATWVEAAAVYFGSRIGAAAAEPFFTKEPLGLTSLASLGL